MMWNIREITGYDHKRKLDGDSEDFNHNELRVLCDGIIKQHPKKKDGSKRLKLL